MKNDRPLITISIDLDIVDEPLLSRSCMRCRSTNFREVHYKPFDESTPGYCSADSDSSIPLAICLNCHRLCTLI